MSAAKDNLLAIWAGFPVTKLITLRDIHSRARPSVHQCRLPVRMNKIWTSVSTFVVTATTCHRPDGTLVTKSPRPP